MKYKFSKPYKFEDKEYSEIELDLDLTRTGQRIPTAASWKFLAAKATKLPVEFFTNLPARDWLKLSGMVSPFFDN